MEMTDAKVVEKKIYEDGKKEYASKGLAGTALGIGIGGLALALLNGNARFCCIRLSRRQQYA